MRAPESSSVKGVRGFLMMISHRDCGVPKEASRSQATKVLISDSSSRTQLLPSSNAHARKTLRLAKLKPHWQELRNDPHIRTCVHVDLLGGERPRSSQSKW